MRGKASREWLIFRVPWYPMHACECVFMYTCFAKEKKKKAEKWPFFFFFLTLHFSGFLFKFICLFFFIFSFYPFKRMNAFVASLAEYSIVETHWEKKRLKISYGPRRFGSKRAVRAVDAGTCCCVHISRLLRGILEEYLYYPIWDDGEPTTYHTKTPHQKRILCAYGHTRWRVQNMLNKENHGQNVDHSADYPNPYILYCEYIHGRVNKATGEKNPPPTTSKWFWPPTVDCISTKGIPRMTCISHSGHNTQGPTTGLFPTKMRYL